MSDGEFQGLVRTTMARLGLGRPSKELILCRDAASHARARAVAEGVTTGSSSSTDNVWVSMETRGRHRKGDIIELSSDALVMEDRGMSKSMGVWVTVAWCACSAAVKRPRGSSVRSLVGEELKQLWWGVLSEPLALGEGFRCEQQRQVDLRGRGNKQPSIAW
eukprot:6492148-Amphidinium_carterae.1